MNNLLLHKKPVMNKKKTITMIKEKNFFQVLRDKKSVKEFDEDEVKGVEIEGYASTKDKDRGHDIVDPQAFKNALDLYMTNPIVLLQHNMEKPIGVVTEATIDDQGLYIKARITQDVDWVISAIKNGVLRAFSIGYKIKDNQFLEEETSDGRNYANIIKDLELFEISVVSVPMNAYSLMKSIGDCFELKEVVAENAKTTDWEDQEEKPADEDKESESDEDEEEKEKKADTDEESDEEEEQDPPADEDDSEDDEDKDKKSLAPEDKKADEQSDIPEDAPEAQDQPENSAGTAEDGQEKSIGSAQKLKDLQIKSVENFISSEMKSIEKKFLDQLAEKDERIGKLEEKLKNALELLGDTITVLGQINKAVENTVVKTWYVYQGPKVDAPANKYSSLVKKLQDS